MTVRTTTKTTVSVILLVIGFFFFRLYFNKLLSQLLLKIIPNEEGYSSIIGERLMPVEYIGSYYTKFFYFCVIIVIVACLLEIILSKKYGLTILSSFAVPLVMTGIISIFLCVEKLNILQLWAIIYLCLIICLHSVFKMIFIHSELVGSYANLKLIKEFFITIKDTILKIIYKSNGRFSNPIDEITVLLASSTTLLFEIMVIISFIVYLSKHWRLIFLSYLVNSF